MQFYTLHKASKKQGIVFLTRKQLMRTTVVTVAALISLYSTILKADTVKIHAIHKETFACTEY